MSCTDHTACADPVARAGRMDCMDCMGDTACADGARHGRMACAAPLACAGRMACDDRNDEIMVCAILAWADFAACPDLVANGDLVAVADCIRRSDSMSSRLRLCSRRCPQTLKTWPAQGPGDAPPPFGTHAGTRRKTQASTGTCIGRMSLRAIATGHPRLRPCSGAGDGLICTPHIPDRPEAAAPAARAQGRAAGAPSPQTAAPPPPTSAAAAAPPGAWATRWPRPPAASS